MAERKSITELNNSQQQEFIDSIWALKRERSFIDGLSTYDRYVILHQKTT